MGRPKYDVEKARRVLRAWVAERIPKAPEDAPITIGTALAHLEARGLKAHRATFIAKGLNALVAEGARAQAEDGGGRRIESERRAYEATVAELRDQLRELDARNRTLLGEIAVLLWNARRLGLTEEDMRQPMPKPNRSESRAGRRRGRSA